MNGWIVAAALALASWSSAPEDMPLPSKHARPRASAPRSAAPPRSTKTRGVEAPADLAEGLDRGLAALKLALPADARRRLLDYLGLLGKWSAVYNLTAVRDAGGMLGLHLLDSLAAWPVIERCLQTLGGSSPRQPYRLADVGSGAGLPGLVWAIADACRQTDRPPIHFTLIDAVEKKVAFQRQAVAVLGLAGTVECTHARVERMDGTEHFDLITSRAFASLPDFVARTSRLLAPHGRWAAMKAGTPHDEIARLHASVCLEEVVPLEVPTLEGAARCVVVLRPSATAPGLDA